jgi:hypothetical protein
VDYSEVEIGSLDKADKRRFRLRVAGAGALLIAKLYKLSDRTRDERRPDRVDSKDAYEAYRLMKLPKAVVVGGWKTCLENDASRAVATEAVGLLKVLFAALDATGPRLAAEYAARAEDPGVTRASAAALSKELLAELV